MTGLGLRKRASAEVQDEGLGMLDVSANALAVLILATMFVLIIAAPPAMLGEVEADNSPDLFYPSPMAMIVAPQSAYWMVSDTGLTRLELDALVAPLAAGATVARTAQGEATLVIDRRHYRDLNDHRLSIVIDWSAVAQSAITFENVLSDPSGLPAILEAFSQHDIVPTFIVTPGGTTAFADIYWHLRGERVPMRWVSAPVGTQLTLSRAEANFERRSRLWQR
jgi:hypothetical protein